MYTYYAAKDRRVFNGALCSDMKKELASLAELRRKAAVFDVRAVYFPMQGQWSAWRGNKQVTDMHDHEGAALCAFLNRHN